MAGEPNNRGEASVPGLAGWPLAAVVMLPAAVGLGSAAHVRQWWTPERSPLFQLSSNFDGTAARPAYRSNQRHELEARSAENAGLARLVAGGTARSPQGGSTGYWHEMTSPAGRLSLFSP